LRYLPTLFFAIPPSDIPDMKQAADINHIDPDTVGVTVRGDRAMDLDAWTILINYLIEELGLDVIWIHTARPHDEYVANHLIKHTGIRVLDRDYDYLEVIGLMRCLGLMLSDRYHACIFALMAGCPLVPFASNTHKVRGLFDLFQYPLPVQNIPKGKELRETFHDIMYAINHRNELSASGLGTYAKSHAKVYKDIRVAVGKCH
jgi:hypothetical protein